MICQTRVPYLRHILEECNAHFDPTQPVQGCQQWELPVVKQNQQEGDTGRCDSETYGGCTESGHLLGSSLIHEALNKGEGSKQCSMDSKEHIVQVDCIAVSIVRQPATSNTSC